MLAEETPVIETAKRSILTASLLRKTLAAVKEAEELHERLQGDQFSVTFGDGEKILGRIVWDAHAQEMCVDYTILFGL